MNRVNSLIKKLDLIPHPEGGWYREVYRSAVQVATPRGPRAAVTTIYYLLERGQHSRWHTVDADEIWHFYDGAPLELLNYEPAAQQLKRHLLAPASAGEAAGLSRPSVSPIDLSQPDLSQPGLSQPGLSQPGLSRPGLSRPSVSPPDLSPIDLSQPGLPVAVIAPGAWQAARSLGDFSLVGCSVGPGFDFADFRLVSSVPGHAEHFALTLRHLEDLL